ncbi:recombinase RecT [Psychrobacillus sp. FSL H8-0487]|uniref:recombinase RecT n=1 Tax=Psychrobacillus sp. FSL H8-0487 TaxID=2921391 RepID=UPI0030F75279
MTKQIELTKEQQSLIWNTKLVPANANEMEAKAFFSVCEEYGLNPLLGDITFQKRETKYGPRVNYLISRDAYLKYGMRQDDFINILSSVVKEGDEFRFDPVEGVPVHSFGPKRGKILGAWCVVKTKTRGNTLVFADFQEYHSSLSSKNPVWNSMPSAMIEKVAHSIALRRTFPLGVVFTGEEEVVETSDFNSEQPNDDVKNTESTPSLTDELEVARKKEEAKKQAKIKAEAKKKQVKQPSDDSSVDKSEPIAEVLPKVETPAETEQPTNVIPSEETPVEIVQEKKEEVIQEEQQIPVSTEPTNELPNNHYEFIHAEVGVSGTKKEKFLKVTAKKDGNNVLLFVQQDKIELFDEIEQGNKFVADTEDRNGFLFVETVQAVA